MFHQGQCQGLGVKRLHPPSLETIVGVPGTGVNNVLSWKVLIRSQSCREGHCESDFNSYPWWRQVRRSVSRNCREGEPFLGLHYLWGLWTHSGILGLLGRSSPTTCLGMFSAKSRLSLMSTNYRETLAFSLKKMKSHVQAYVKIRVRRSDSQGSLNFT